MEPLFTAAYAGAGSTYKYFTAATALAAGAPTSLKLTTPNNTYTTKNCHTHYRVHNAGHYPDTMPLADALPQSSNTYFVALEDQFFGCQLGPVVDTAVRLGMNRLQQPLDDSAAGSIAHEVATSGEPTFTLGQEPTSPLELTGAFSAAVNDGMLCPPHPVLRVVTPKGAAMHLPLPPCHRVLSQYVARTVTTLMRADTTRGTAASYFRDWYAHGGASVAGKTGTDNNAADDGNSALWFVGMTPRLVSAASLVDPAHPKATVHGLPGLPDAFVAQDVFGAYASTYWLDAYGPALRGSWSWPSADQLDGATVPTVVGQERSDAVAQLQAAGYQVAVFPVECGSNRPAGEVAYQEPPRAPRGATVTICLSNGMAPYVYRPPVFVPRPAPRAPRPKPAPAPAPPPRHHHHHGG
jgi:membrane peptidoglycan carboxypeptidase